MRILVLDDEWAIRESIKQVLPYVSKVREVHTAGSCAEARELLSRYNYDVIFADYYLKNDEYGTDIAEEARPIPLVVMTGDQSSRPTSDIVRARCAAFIQKPCNAADLKKALFAVAQIQEEAIDFAAIALTKRRRETETRALTPFVSAPSRPQPLPLAPPSK